MSPIVNRDFSAVKIGEPSKNYILKRKNNKKINREDDVKRKSDRH